MNRSRIRHYSYFAVTVFTIKGIVTLALIVAELEAATALLARLDGLPPALVGPIAAATTSLIAGLAALLIFLWMRRRGGRCPMHVEPPPERELSA